MGTETLFWKDPYVKEFEAKVISVNGKEVILDRSCFFPQGGGQVGDTGFLNDMRVVDTRKDENYNITHFLEKEAFKAGGVVKGKIDWEKRYRTMRLHSAAHVVYYLLLDMFGEKYKLASSGIVNEKKDITDYLTDLPFDAEKLKIVGSRANELIKKGGEIRTWSEESRPNYRYWEIDGFPKMPCGGTHPKRLEEIGEVVVHRGKKPGAGKERIEILLR